MNNHRPLLASLAAAAVLAGCASQSENYVLLPGPDGKTGSLNVVVKGQPPLVLDKAYQAAAVDASAARLSQLDAATVQQRYGDALAVQPPPALRFVLYFQEGSDELTADSKRDFARIPQEIAQRPAPDVVVIGHTDSVGKLEDNDQLALRRANRLRQRLLQEGIGAENVQATGRGERELLVATPDETAEPRNRRVEILVR